MPRQLSFRLLIALMTLMAANVTSQPARSRKLSQAVTSLLDNLLADHRYDRRIRPDFGGPPVLITVNMYIRSIGPVSETDEVFSLDCYFRQTWIDPRLKNNSTNLQELSLNWLFLEKVWKPDTYFLNGRRSYLHSITVPNRFLRLRLSDGFLTYSMRLTIEAQCPMSLRKFPLDFQACPLEIGSYGYAANEVRYRWQLSGSDAVGLEKGVNLAQYDLVNITTTQMIHASNRREDFSTVKVYFHLQRHTGYFMLQVYVPCMLIVSCSWVSFWIDATAVPARVSLGVTTVLSMTTLGFGGRGQMPRVSYATALDWFVILCFSFVFASMVEYAAINFIEMLGKSLRGKLEEGRKKKESAAAKIAAEALQKLEENEQMNVKTTVAVIPAILPPSLPPPPPPPPPTIPPSDQESSAGNISDVEAPSSGARAKKKRSIGKSLRRRMNMIPRQIADCSQCVPISAEKSDNDQNVQAANKADGVESRYLMKVLTRLAQEGTASQIDLYSRRAFPLLFVFLNSCYWIAFIYIIPDEKPVD